MLSLCLVYLHDVFLSWKHLLTSACIWCSWCNICHAPGGKCFCIFSECHEIIPTILWGSLADLLCLLHCRVEYFGQKLEGFTFTTGGWVQSYGSRYGVSHCCLISGSPAWSPWHGTYNQTIYI